MIKPLPPFQPKKIVAHLLLIAFLLLAILSCLALPCPVLSCGVVYLSVYSVFRSGCLLATLAAYSKKIYSPIRILSGVFVTLSRAVFLVYSISSLHALFFSFFGSNETKEGDFFLGTGGGSGIGWYW